MIEWLPGRLLGKGRAEKLVASNSDTLLVRFRERATARHHIDA